MANKPIPIRFTKSERDMLEYMADYRGLNMSQYIKMLIKQDFNGCELKEYTKKLDKSISESN